MAANTSGGLAPILEVADQLMRSWWTVVAGACLGLSLALVALHFLPKTYEAITKILVAPPKIPQDFVKNTVSDDAAVTIAALKDAVLSRPYMLTLIDKTYGPQASEADTQQLLKTLRARVDVTVERFSGERTGMFAIRFRDPDPNRAAAFVNDLADLYIKENSKYRSSRAQETTETLEQLLDDVRSQLEEKEKLIAEFKAKHLFELPERTDANLRLLESRQRDLDVNLKALQSAQDRLQMLQAQLQSAGATYGSPTLSATSAMDAYAIRLSQLQKELAALRARYKDDHPEVKAKEREIHDFVAGAEDPTNAEVVGGAPRTPAGPPMSPLEREIQSQKAEVAGLQDEQSRIRSDIAIYGSRIEAAPQVQLQLEERMKGYDVLQQQFRDYKAKVEAAKGAQTIEEAQKGEQFEVLERAIPPAVPVRPMPALVIAVGVLGGLFLFAGPVVLKGVLRPTILSEEILRSMVAVPVLVSIPRLETEAVQVRARRDRFRNIAFSTFSVAVLVAVVAILMPR